MVMQRSAAIFLACGALLFGTGCSAQASDEQRFAADMAAQLRQRLPGVQVVAQKDPLSVALKGGGRPEMTLNFHRVYGYCRHASAADCKVTREEFLDNVVRNPTPPPPTPESLRIAVHDAQYMRQVPVTFSEPIGDDLFAVLVSQSRVGVATVPPEALAKLGLTREEAWGRAWQQTRATLPDLPNPATLVHGAVAYVEQPYLASLLVDTKGWGAIADTAGPDLFVTVIADDDVFVGRMPDGATLQAFKQTAREDCAGRQRCLSPNVYRFRDGRWVVAH